MSVDIELLTSDLNLARAWARLMKLLRDGLVGGGVSEAAQAQSDWFIDSVAGSDLNSGETAGTAIKTWAELARRTGIDRFAWVIDHPVTVELLDDLPVTDPITINTTVVIGGQLDIIGQRTVVDTQTTTAFSKDFANNVPSNITAGVGWTPQVGSLLQFTSGPAIGAFAWIAKDLGGNQAWIGSAATRGLPNQPGGGLVDPAGGGGDDFEVYSLSSAQLNQVNVMGMNPVDFPATEPQAFVRFQDLNLTEPQPNGQSSTHTSWGPSVVFLTCQLGNIRAAGNTDFQNSSLEFLTAENTGVLVETGLATRIGLDVGTSMQFANHPLMVGSFFILQRGSSVRASDMLGVYDSVTDGVIVEPGAQLAVAAILHGSGNAGAGINNIAGMVLTGAGPAITGAGGEVEINGQIKTWAQTPYVDPKGGGSVSTYITTTINTAFDPIGSGDVQRTSGPITNTGAAQFLLPDGTEQANAVPGTTVPVQGHLVPNNGTIKNLRVRCDVAPGAPLPVTIWVVPVGTSAPAASILTATIGAASLEASDVTNQVTVAPGDLLVVEHVNPGGSTATNLSVAFEVA